MESATSLNKWEESPYGRKPPQNTLVLLEWWRRDYPTYPIYSEQGVPLLFRVYLNHSPGNEFPKHQTLALTMTHHGTTHKDKDDPSSHLFPYSGSEQNFISWRMASNDSLHEGLLATTWPHHALMQTYTLLIVGVFPVQHFFMWLWEERPLHDSTEYLFWGPGKWPFNLGLCESPGIALSTRGIHTIPCALLELEEIGVMRLWDPSLYLASTIHLWSWST